MFIVDYILLKHLTKEKSMKNSFWYFGDLFGLGNEFWDDIKQDTTRFGVVQYEEDGHLIVELSLPGKNVEDVEVFVENDEITIKAAESKNKIFPDRFERKFVSKSGKYDLSTTYAKMKNGILTLTIAPKDGKEKKKLTIFNETS